MNFKNELKKAFGSNKKIFLTIILVFIIGGIIGYCVSDYIADSLMPILKESLAEEITSNDALNIIIHNENSAITTFLASFLFGIMAVISSFMNGFIIGFLAAFTVDSYYSLMVFLALILPHGIIEIPALIIDCVSGILLFKLIYGIIKDLYHKNSFRDSLFYNKDTFKHMIILLAISLLLFVIAGIIEGYLTPHIGNIVSQLLGGQALF